MELLSTLPASVDDLSTFGSDRSVDNELYVEMGVGMPKFELFKIGKLTFGLKFSFIWFWEEKSKGVVWVIAIFEDKFVGFSEVNVFDELNFDDDEKAVFKESNLALGAVMFEYKLTKCRGIING